MSGYAKLSMFMFECMHATFGWTCFELDQIEVYNLKFRGSTRKGQKLLEYIYVYPLRVLVRKVLKDRLEMALCLVYFSSSQCHALYVQLFAVQFNFINNSFNNTTMNYNIWLLLRILQLTCLFVFQLLFSNMHCTEWLNMQSQAT